MNKAEFCVQSVDSPHIHVMDNRQSVDCPRMLYLPTIPLLQLRCTWIKQDSTRNLWTVHTWWTICGLSEDAVPPKYCGKVFPEYCYVDIHRLPIIISVDIRGLTMFPKHNLWTSTDCSCSQIPSIAHEMHQNWVQSIEIFFKTFLGGSMPPDPPREVGPPTLTSAPPIQNHFLTPLVW